ncbi:hypothetical protein C9374_014345 [Naegleria lovaniensis]|uniref:Endonuclease/exonuclease/phosphatase domain-containing protein n=1 Tax=Naegleria lovaniensis TaxID=51637 RepID=A0AA88KMH0_NAELO|nr:uncharacterized protein C9374_014345 [Naegleria lovaniensis]KAG2388945.1 hypothetical protein C9374_014345 [Naegleria lovaniensis]
MSRSSTTILSSPTMTGQRTWFREDQSGNNIELLNQDQTVAGNSSFTLVSYNILAQLYAKHLQVSDPKICDWEQRKERLYQELMSYQADIICLQEMDLYRKYWQSMMKDEGFDSSYVEKTGKRNGCGTFWKRDRFEQVNVLELHLEELENYIEKEELGNEKRFARRDAANLTLLKDLQTGKLLLIVNNHLAWDPAYPEVKLCQMFYILQVAHQWLKKVCQKQGQHHNSINDINSVVSVILCGDYNSLPDSEVYDLITKGRAQIPGKEIKFNKNSELVCDGVENVKSSTHSSHHSHSSKQYLLNPFTPAKSAYFEIYGKEPKFTNYTSTFYGTLDYVFTFNFDWKHGLNTEISLKHIENEDQLKQQHAPQQLQVTDVLGEISLEQAQEFSFIPSLIFPSDHIAHCVKFSWISHNF